MSEALIIALINLVAKVGIDAAMVIMDGMKNAKTIDEAIAALNAAKTKTWADYKAESKLS